MPRRSARQVASGDASAPKKSKLGWPQIDNLDVRFEWRGDGKNQWIKYNKKFNRVIADAYNAKKSEVDLTLPNGIVMAVNLDKMVQKNKKTGFERSVRCTFRNNSNDDFEVTQWQDDQDPKLWNPYTVPSSLEIETAFQNGLNSFTTKTTRTPYLIDLKKMTQTNTKTKFSRKIQRGPSQSDDPLDGDEDEDEDKEEEKKEEADENEEEEEEEEEIVPKSRRGKSAASSLKSSVKTVVVKKGSSPVDDVCPVASKTSIYTAVSVNWDCMLNQTNIANNNNKYYLIQLLTDASGKLFYVWLRWGRVGYAGQTNLAPFQSDLEGAKKFFCKKFQDKTGNSWAQKDSFTKYPGKYDLVKIDYNTGEDDSVPMDGEEKDENDEAVPDSKLEESIQNLIQLICDVKSMEDAVVEMKYDAKKAPLGKLTKEQIKGGYLALKEIEDLIIKKDFGRNLSDACSEFYTRIPHEFGMQVPPLICTPQDVKKKLQLLEALEDIEIAIKMLKKGDKSENPLDRHYHQMACDLTPLDKSSDDFKLIDDYLQKTHGSTHKLYKMQLEDVFECNRQGESQAFDDRGNRMLLWHGSRLTNWASILSQGLRIAPPEAPVTGYMFGKGVYFADISSKSANYCFASRAKNTGLMLLCDVSLGDMEEKIQADPNAAKLPAGKHSVKGLGMTAPDEKSYVTTPDGVVVPVGKVIQTNMKQQNMGFTLQYNEFIVYDVCQIRMKYLLKIKFNFK